MNKKKVGDSLTVISQPNKIELPKPEPRQEMRE